MANRVEKRTFTGMCLLIVGCTSIANLDDLTLDPAAGVDGGAWASPEAGASATDVSPLPVDERGPDAADVEGGRVVDAGVDVADGSESTVQDAGVLTPTCWLQNNCRCSDKSDCPGPEFECCNGTCTDIGTDTLHCGRCGNPCPSNQTCDRGQCACPGLFPDQACVEGVCIDFMSDNDHCGRCGHSCLGGQCLGQACQAVAMATQQDEPMGIAVDSDYVYFANKGGNTVGKLPKDAKFACHGSSCPLFTSPLLNEPVSVITQDGDARVYVSNHASGGTGNIVGIPKGPWSGSAEVLATGNGLWGLAMRAGTVYFSARQDPNASVGRILADGGVGPAARGNRGYEVTAVAIVGDWIFFGARLHADPGPPSAGLFKVSVDPSCPAGGCAPMLVSAGSQPRAITSNNQYVFWTSDDDKIRRISKSCSGAPCQATVIAEGQSDAQSIVADTAFVYWANADGGGTIRKSSVFTTCRGVGCQSITAPLGKVYGLAQDDKALYFTTRSSGPPATGIVWRIAK